MPSLEEVINRLGSEEEMLDDGKAKLRGTSRTLPMYPGVFDHRLPTTKDTVVDVSELTFLLDREHPSLRGTHEMVIKTGRIHPKTAIIRDGADFNTVYQWVKRVYERKNEVLFSSFSSSRVEIGDIILEKSTGDVYILKDGKYSLADGYKFVWRKIGSFNTAIKELPELK